MTKNPPGRFLILFDRATTYENNRSSLATVGSRCCGSYRSSCREILPEVCLSLTAPR